MSGDRNSHDHGGDPECSGLGCVTRFDPVIVRSRPLLYAYAASLIILSLGLVALILGLTLLCFFYPERANAFLLLLGSPAVAVLLTQAPKLRRLTKRGPHAQNKR